MYDNLEEDINEILELIDGDMTRSADGMNRILNDVLMTEKLRQNKLSIELKENLLTELVYVSLRNTRCIFETKNIKTSLQIDNSLNDVIALYDFQRLNQDNLVLSE